MRNTKKRRERKILLTLEGLKNLPDTSLDSTLKCIAEALILLLEVQCRAKQ